MKELIKKLNELRGKATQGEWWIDAIGDNKSYWIESLSHSVCDMYHRGIDGNYEEQLYAKPDGRENADYIVAMHETLPELISNYEKAVKVLEDVAMSGLAGNAPVWGGRSESDARRDLSKKAKQCLSELGEDT